MKSKNIMKAILAVLISTGAYMAATSGPAVASCGSIWATCSEGDVSELNRELASED